MQQKKDIIITRLRNFAKSIWFFPTIVTIALLCLVSFQVSGSSIGIYHSIFYGNEIDKDLILNRPQGIRSDEWKVASQKTIAQVNDNFNTINQNMGEGEDVSLVSDVAYNDWSVIFKPQNIGFLFLPLDTAFSLHWWIMAYFIIITSYFFVLLLLPKKYFLASIISLAFVLSPFIQWWYQYITLAPIYYTLAGILLFIAILKAKKVSNIVWLSIFLAYVVVCFALVLYPPFQIPCAIVGAVFVLCYILTFKDAFDKKQLKLKIFLIACSILVALAAISLFVFQRIDTINTIQSTAYPGQRIVTSGGYNFKHFLSSNVSPIHQSLTRSNNYVLPGIASNQSETSNFILLAPLLLLPALFLAYRKFKEDKKVDYLVAGLVLLSIFFLVWMFVPGINFLGKITLLDKVPHARLLIGWGVINLLLIVSYIRLYKETRKTFSLRVSVIYSTVILAGYLAIGINLAQSLPNFISTPVAILFALPFPLLIYCLMRGYFRTMAVGMLLFSILSTFYIHPLYRGTDILTQTPLSIAIREIGGSSDKKWVSDNTITEGFTSMNGQPSLTGVYFYPQLEVWDDLNQPSEKDIYNRYAHVSFSFDRSSETIIKPSFSLPSPDRFVLNIEPCNEFFKQNNVGYIITTTKFNIGEANCAKLVQIVSYPTVTFYIYAL